MKRLLLFVALILISLGLSAQSKAVLVQEYFSGNSIPSGWSILGMGQQNWSVSPTSYAGGEQGEMLMYYSPQFNGISRFVTPALDLTGLDEVIFSFKHYLDNYQGSHTLGIATSSDNGATWNVGWQQNYGADGAYQVIQTIHTADLGKENVKFCIFYQGNSYNFDNWYFDNVEIFVLENLDLQMNAVVIPDIVSKEEPVPVTFSFANYGVTPITSFDASYQVNNEEPVVEHFDVNVNSLNSGQVTFVTPIVELPGDYIVNVEVANVNGVGDDVLTNNTKAKKFGCAYGSTDRVPMIEHFSSSSCGPCVATNNTMNTFCNNNPGRFTYTKYAMNWPGSGDPYYTQEGNVRRVYYGVSGVPTLYLDGVTRSAAGFQTPFDTEAERPAYVDIRGNFTVEGNIIHVQFDLMSYVGLEDVRLLVTVNEKETHNNIGGNGETTFHHVMMKMLPNGNGTLLNMAGCEVRHFEFTQDMTSTHVEEMDDLEVSVFLQNVGTRDVYNSHFLNEDALFPAPVQNLTMVCEDNRETGLITATWEAPEGGEALMGYRVVLDGVVVEELTSDLSYSFESESEVFHVIEVQAIYRGDVTSVNAVTSINYVWDVEEDSTVHCRLYPNPANGMVSVQANENLNEIRVYNALGMLVNTINASGMAQTIDVTSYANGVYFIQMNTESGVTATRRLMVSH